MTTQTTDTEAPFGLKADGTPRLRAAPTWRDDPKKVAAANKKRSQAMKARAAAKKNGAGAVARTTKPKTLSAEELLAHVTAQVTAALEVAEALVAERTAALADAQAERDRLATFVTGTR